jgi:hypothetical protein
MGFDHMAKVTSNHNTPLSVAGVVVGVGKSVGIDDDKLRAALGSNAVRQWLKLKLIEIEGLSDADIDEIVQTRGKGSPNRSGSPVSVSIPGFPTTVPQQDADEARAALEAKATEVGVQGQISKMKDETIIAKIAEIEAAAAGN